MARVSPHLPFLAAERLARPLPAYAAIAVGTVLLLAGAAYCIGNVTLSGGTAIWARALAWSLGAILPWFVLLEGIKRTEVGKGQRLGAKAIALFVFATGLCSLAIEAVIDWTIWGMPSAPLGLQMLRRLPAIAAFFGLLLVLRTRANLEPAAAMPLAAFAPWLRYVRAADNYLELHLGGRMVMRRQTLAQAESELARHGFIRIHRSILVHPRTVQSVEMRGSRSVLILADGERLPVGARYSGAARHFAT